MNASLVASRGVYPVEELKIALQSKGFARSASALVSLKDMYLKVYWKGAPVVNLKEYFQASLQTNGGVAGYAERERA